MATKSLCNGLGIRTQTNETGQKCVTCTDRTSLESFGLEKTYKVIESNHKPNMPGPPHRVPRVNVGCGPAEERVLLTGLHAVADIYCENCKTTLGWKYEHAFESSQKYKEGKFIIELAHMIKDNGWE
ncbi:protein yippee-like 1 [Pitangus sulphuratus]|nr:protein yippee-like 1 [Pitangus sulphuratus]